MRQMQNSRRENGNGYTGKNYSSSNKNQDVINKYSNSGYVSFNYKQSCLKSGIKRYDNTLSLFISITNLTEDNKFVKNEDGKFDSGFFNLNLNELAQLNYYLEKMTYNESTIDPNEITGLAFEHTNKDKDNGESNGSGSILEVYRDESGIINISISYYSNNEIDREYNFKLSGDTVTTVYTLSNQDGVDEKINIEELKFKQLISSSFSMISLGIALFEVRNTVTRSTNNSTSSTSSTAKSLINKKRNTLSSKPSASSEMVELDDLSNILDNDD
jgi:predicted transport protein